MRCQLIACSCLHRANTLSSYDPRPDPDPGGTEEEKGKESARAAAGQITSMHLVEPTLRRLCEWLTVSAFVERANQVLL